MCTDVWIASKADGDLGMTHFPDMFAFVGIIHPESGVLCGESISCARLWHVGAGKQI